ncbi:Transcriptional regulatory protein DegU [Tepidimonas alkaliphilus]|uniref:Transcriptional regulatory protein DegU n=1 Tax=Tepidimonas alkaliphilus TaxID=2588942 RepID=A0A554WAF0_9BURK|nr:response regulator transcription factor [Tepidimonas alkaliphilus]TSE20557.1 Transcriptional regulatory protein DegU [Tepidimonas alkaliphilus]
MSGITRIYLIEDDRSILRFVEEALRLRPDWKLVGQSETFAHAQRMAPHSLADVFLVDLGLPDGRGEDMLRLLAEARPDAELLVFTVFGDETRLIRALQMGATGYVLKGCSTQELIEAIEQIRQGGAPISPLLARMLLKQFRQLGEAPDPLAEGPAPTLSERETDVLRLVAQGYVNKEIAQRLGIGVATVSTHIKNLYRKLAVRTRVQVVRAAQARGLL